MVVIRCEEPKGGPGLREMSNPSFRAAVNPGLRCDLGAARRFGEALPVGLQLLVEAVTDLEQSASKVAKTS